MKQEKTQDFDIEGKDYTLKTVGGRLTKLTYDGEYCESFLEFLDEREGQGELLEKFLKNLLRRGLRIKDIIKWCILELKNGNEIYYFMYEDLLYVMNDSNGNGSLQYDLRYGLSKGVFMQAMRTCQTLSEEDLKEAMREELLKNLPKCKTIEDFCETYRFRKLADDSPILKKILEHDKKMHSR